MKKIKSIGLVCVIALSLCGCNAVTQNEQQIQSLEFTVLDESAMPDKVLQQIEEMKREPFEYIYSDREYLYICIGYGEQETKGYSIAVDDLYLTESAIYAETTLLGPSEDYRKHKEPSYPYIVIKTDYLEQTIIVK